MDRTARLLRSHIKHPACICESGNLGVEKTSAKTMLHYDLLVFCFTWLQSLVETSRKHLAVATNSNFTSPQDTLMPF